MLVKIWFIYLLFIRRIYTRRGKNFQSAAESLAKICLLFLFMFIFSVLELIFDFKGLIYLVGLDIPLVPIIIIPIVFLMIIFYFLNRNNKSLKSISIKRSAIKVSKKFKLQFAILYVVMCVLLFILTLLMVIYNNI